MVVLKGVVIQITLKEGTESGKKLGFIDFDFYSNVVGTKRSCIHDCFAIVGNIYGRNFKDEIYNDCPPHTYKDTLLASVLQSNAVNFFLLS